MGISYQSIDFQTQCQDNDHNNKLGQYVRSSGYYKNKVFLLNFLLLLASLISMPTE